MGQGSVSTGCPFSSSQRNFMGFSGLEMHDAVLEYLLNTVLLDVQLTPLQTYSPLAGGSVVRPWCSHPASWIDGAGGMEQGLENAGRASGSLHCSGTGFPPPPLTTTVFIFSYYLQVFFSLTIA